MSAAAAAALFSFIQSSILCLKIGLCTSSKIMSLRHAQKSTSQILDPIELTTLTDFTVSGWMGEQRHMKVLISLSETPSPALEAGKDSVSWERHWDRMLPNVFIPHFLNH